MRIRSAFGRILAVLAIVGLALAPVVRPAMAVPLSKDMHATMSGSAVDTVIADAADEMPCCPSKPALPDWSRDCPLMALCVAAPVHFVSADQSNGSLTFVASAVFRCAHSDLVSVAYAPPRKPPKI